MDKNTTTTEPTTRFRVEGRQTLDVYQWVDTTSPEEAIQIAGLNVDDWELDMDWGQPADCSSVTDIEVGEEEEL